MAGPYIFGVRHLSPAAAWHLRRTLDEVRPRLILVEGPSDFSDQMDWMCHPDTVLPAAMLAYTRESPVRTILYPFAVYSPEYQAIRGRTRTAWNAASWICRHRYFWPLTRTNRRTATRRLPWIPRQPNGYIIGWRPSGESPRHLLGAAF